MNFMKFTIKLKFSRLASFTTRKHFFAFSRFWGVKFMLVKNTWYWRQIIGFKTPWVSIKNFEIFFELQNFDIYRYLNSLKISNFLLDFEISNYNLILGYCDISQYPSIFYRNKIAVKVDYHQENIGIIFVVNASKKYVKFVATTTKYARSNKLHMLFAKHNFLFFNLFLDICISFFWR